MIQISETGVRFNKLSPYNDIEDIINLGYYVIIILLTFIIYFVLKQLFDYTYTYILNYLCLVSCSTLTYYVYVTIFIACIYDS